jgi:hypothetical protein
MLKNIFRRYKFQHKTPTIIPSFTKLHAEFYKKFVDLCKTYQSKCLKQQNSSIFAKQNKILIKKILFVRQNHS